MSQRTANMLGGCKSQSPKPKAKAKAKGIDSQKIIVFGYSYEIIAVLALLPRMSSRSIGEIAVMSMQRENLSIRVYATQKKKKIGKTSS